MTPVSETYLMDCMDYMRTMPDKYFDLAVVDPPYGGANSSIAGGKRFGGRFDRYKPDGRNMGGEIRKKIISWDVAPDQEYFKELFRVSKHQVIFGANYFQGLPPTRCFFVWRKLSISDSFSMAMCEYAWTSFSSNAKLFECHPQGDKKDRRFHPTQKPVALYAYLFRQFAKPGDKILDTHLGSGSSRIAAYKMGFDFYATEIDKEYYTLQEERFRKECLRETTVADGRVYVQHGIFQ